MTRRLLLFTSLSLTGSLVFWLTPLGWSQTGANASAPAADISNGQLRARLWLPDPEKGFYRGTRFDWSGSIANLSYQGHTYFGEWFVRYDPAVRDVAWIPGTNGYAAGKASANVGPVEEFTGPGNSAPGYDEAKPGGTFLKIGVGALRKPLDGKEGKYDHYSPYEIADSGKWTVRKSSDHVEFTQTLAPGNGYAYEYSKTVRLVPGSSDMMLEHSLKNTGSKTLESSVYDHNFLINDHQPPGPPLHILFPFDVKAEGAMPRCTCILDSISSRPIEMNIIGEGHPSMSRAAF